jgi:hypothetical protein
MELSIDATSVGGGSNLTIYLSDNQFGPASGNFTALLDSHLVSGSDGTMTFNTYYDASNTLFALTTPLTASGFLSADNSGTVWQGGTIGASPFSLTEVVTLGAGGANGATYSLAANLQSGCATNGQIGDFVWNDLNGNGCQDAGEPGISSVKVDLYAGCGVAGTPVASTLTDASGHYLFSGLCPGTYTVSFNSPTGYTRTTAHVGCVNSNLPAYQNQLDSKCDCEAGTPCGVCVTLTTANPVNLNVDCGYVTNCNGQIGDFVWNDLNGNGCQDAGEPGISSVKVDLYAGCGVAGTPVASTLTDTSGHYLFSGLCPGTYTVSFNSPTGYTRTTAHVGCVNSSLPAYQNQLDSKCACATGGPCGVCVTLTTANPVNLNVDCGYVCSGQFIVTPQNTKQDVITFSLTRYAQSSISISNAANTGNWSDAPTIYKTATSRVTTADILKAIAIVLHGNAGYYPASAQLVLVQGEIGGFFGYPYVSTLDDVSTTDGDNIRLASGRNMTNNPVNGALPLGHNQPWGQIFVKEHDSTGNATLCENVSFFFAIQVEECYDCFYLNSFITDTTFKFTERSGPPCCAGSAATGGNGKDKYYMTLQFDNTLNNPYLNPDGIVYPAGTTNGTPLIEHADFYDQVGGLNGLYPPTGTFHVVGLRERENGVDPDGLPYLDSIRNNVQSPSDHHSYDIYTMRFALKGIVTYTWALKFVNKSDAFPDFVGTGSFPVTGYGYVSKVCSMFSGTVSFNEGIVAASKCCLDFPWRSVCGGAAGGYWFGIGDFDIQADLAPGDTGYIENYYNTAVPGYHLGDAVPVNTDLDLSFHPNFDHDYEPIKQALGDDYPQPGFEGTWVSDPANPVVQDVQPPQSDGRPADGGQR